MGLGEDRGGVSFAVVGAEEVCSRLSIPSIGSLAGRECMVGAMRRFFFARDGEAE